jgi:L,D-peptidoglycan transpeptidase YkuD (ErfK/YbiS/YcfS/YnhG family)
MRGRLWWAIGLLSALVLLTGCASNAKHPVAHSPTASSSSASAAPTVEATTSAPVSLSASALPRAALGAVIAPTTAAAPTPQPLPLSYSTGSATQVITVVAHSTSATTATLQRWTKSGTGWLPDGAAVTSHVGSAGMTATPNEGAEKTPMGSFTLTQAFGHDPNPGTALPYLQTTPADWWISQAGPLYNTEQRCASNCAFTQGNPNEHLYYETPFYNYAVVIDYNTANAGPIRQGAGSAFFLHVTDGNPTAGCVSVPQATEISILQWLQPADAPRILIGTA